MFDMKAKIIDSAIRLLDQLAMCEDDSFVEEIVNAIYYNDAKALEYMEEELSE